MEIMTNLLKNRWIWSLCTLALIGCGKEDSLKTQSINNNIANGLIDGGYVGDQECSLCHIEIFNTFKQNGMGRSLYVPTAQNIIEDYQSNTKIYDENNNLYYEAIHKDGVFYQKEYRPENENTAPHELIYKVDYIIGSGNHTRSYLRKENGFIYEMPMTWYSQKRKWDLSPSYNLWNQRFSRPIIQECMNCHNSYTQYQDYSTNQFDDPIPHGIGCERCHGPGLEHVKKRMYEETDLSASGSLDSSIVNPAYLSASKQVDVCFQCHLQGEMTVFKKGKQQTNFKPGMDITEIKSIYIDSDQNPTNPSIASHGLRMLMSLCYINSQGKMYCTTCHDPHTSIDKTPVSNYSKACLSCHRAELLSNSNQEIDHRPAANCVSCHMLKSETSDIPHVTGTDHWIRKSPQVRTKRELQNKEIVKKLISLEPVFKESDSAADIRLGIAYIKYFEAKQPDANYLNKGISLIKSGLLNQPDHSSGLFYLGKAYAHRKEYLQAESQFKRVISIDSKNALAHFELAKMQSIRGKIKLAKNSLLTSIKLFNNNANAYNNLGNIYSELNQLQEAATAYKRAIDITPSDPSAYHNLGDLWLSQQHSADLALPYISKALELSPDFIPSRLNMGVINMLLGNDEKSIYAFNQCLDLNPDLISAHGNLARIYIRANNHQQALFHINTMLNIQPGNKDATSLLHQINR